MEGNGVLIVCGSARPNLHLPASFLTTLALLCLNGRFLPLLLSVPFDKICNERKCFCIVLGSPVSYLRSEKWFVAPRPLGTYFSGWKLDQHNEYPLCKFNINSTPKVKRKLMTIFYIQKSVMKPALHFMLLSF